MYLIALCDDDEADLNKTEKMLGRYEERHVEVKFMTERFENAEQLLGMVREKGYAPDLVLMDIYMQEKLGKHAARELRNMGNNCKIVFLTTSKEHALDAYAVDAVQYLVKPVSETMLFPILDRLLKETEEERRKYIVLRIDGKIRRVALNDVVCCEAHGKTQHLYLTDNRHYVLRITMAELNEMMACYREIVRVGAAYIVNLDHVDSFNAQELHMDNGKKIFLPRGSFQSLREKYFDYYCG